MITTIIFIGLFVITLGLSVYMYFNKNKKIKILKKTIEEKLFKLKTREGFYEITYNLNDIKYGGKENSPYKVRIYVTELEKYTNDYSKIILNKIVVDGFSHDHYNTAKLYAKSGFNEVKKTSNITWLEKEKDITELRKNKLERILKETE